MPPSLPRLKTLGALRNQPRTGSGAGKVQQPKKKAAASRAGAATAGTQLPPLLISSFLTAFRAQGEEGGLLTGSEPPVSSRRLDLYAAAEIAAVREECESLAADNDGLGAWATDYALEARAAITGVFSCSTMPSGGGNNIGIWLSSRYQALPAVCHVQVAFMLQCHQRHTRWSTFCHCCCSSSARMPLILAQQATDGF